MRFSTSGRALERLAGGTPSGPPRAPGRWRTVGGGGEWPTGREVTDQEWLRHPAAGLAREALQQTLLFPAARMIARPRVIGAGDLMHAPQPAVIAANHASDIDTPLILAGLPRAWRVRTVVGAASDRFYRRRAYALSSALWINTFPFDRGGDLRGLADAAELLRDGYNVLLYPQATRAAGQVDGFRSGVARLCLATGAPIVPVHVAGTAMIMPKGRGLTQRGRATVSFGRPIFPDPDEDSDDLIDRTRAAIAELAGRHSRAGTGPNPSKWSASQRST